MKILLPVLHRFNQAVEATIRKALKGELVRLAPPNESVIALYEPWSSHSTVVPRGPVVASGSHTQGEKSIPVDRNTEPGDSRPNTIIHGSGRANSSSSTVSVTIQSDSRKRSWYLEQGEHISKELVPGEIILVQTSAIHLQISCTGEQLMGDADTPTGSYRLHVEHLNKGSGMASGTQVVDVDKLRCDREETLCLDRLSGVSRIVCRSGEHRVCLSIDKTPGKGVLWDMAFQLGLVSCQEQALITSSEPRYQIHAVVIDQSFSISNADSPQDGSRKTWSVESHIWFDIERWPQSQSNTTMTATWSKSFTLDPPSLFVYPFFRERFTLSVSFSSSAWRSDSDGGNIM
jgi:hypothetical protein